MKPSRQHVAAVIGVCLVLRLAFFGLVGPWRTDAAREAVLVKDAGRYHRLAGTLLATGRFALRPHGPPDVFRTPLYPGFVAGVYALAGPAPWAAVLAQIVLDTAACGLLLVALERLVGTHVAVVGGAFYALDPLLIVYANSLLSEQLFVFFLVAALAALGVGLTAARGPALVAFAASGLSVGLATLVKPAAQFLPILFLGLLAIRYRRRLRRALACGGLWLALFAAAVAPWLTRNYATFGRVALSTSGSYQLLAMQVRGMEMAGRQEDQNEVMGELHAEVEALMAAEGRLDEKANPFVWVAYCRRLALQYIAAQPGRFAKACLRGVFHALASPGTAPAARLLRLPAKPFNVKHYRNPVAMLAAYLRSKTAAELAITAVSGLFLLLSYAAALVGLVAAWRRGPRDVLLFCGLVAAYFVAIAGPYGLARYKVPAIPFYLPVVGLGAVTAWRRIRRRGRPAAEPSAGP